MLFVKEGADGASNNFYKKYQKFRYSLDLASEKLVLEKHKTRAGKQGYLSRNVLTSHSKIIWRFSLN